MLSAFQNGFRSEVKLSLETQKSKKIKTFKVLTGITVQDKNQLLDCYLISVKEVSDPVQLSELIRNTESIIVWTKELSEKKLFCNKLLFS